MKSSDANRISSEAKVYIDELGMVPHPEGGFYKEIYQPELWIEAGHWSIPVQGRRRSATSIYFLLPSGDVSRFHRLNADEMWYFHAGSPVCIVTIDSDGKRIDHHLGLDIQAGQFPQILVPRGTIFGAYVMDENPNAFALVGCMVTPGFDFQDFQLLGHIELLKNFPYHRDIIEKLGG